ncbi:MAG: hypothetical protein A2157_08995 [Deltaproteobacteria bacterium RBG_16_47_11]|nr:MAG: hypothetical protein A2157_08995 [Deltaproteobacteria bacterium RBG_16_47_11]
MSQKKEEQLTTNKKLVELEERIVHEFKIVSEELMQKIELVAEGVTNVHENMGRVEKRLTEKIDSVGVDLPAVIRFLI